MRNDSREFVRVRVSANVTLDEQPVEIGFQARGFAPAWFDAEWVGSAATTREARILVGPEDEDDVLAPSVGVLPAGGYEVLYKVTDDPEIPVERAYSLIVSDAGTDPTVVLPEGEWEAQLDEKVDKGTLVFYAAAEADGVTDDTAAIQAVIDLAEAASSFGATVQLPSGDMLTATGVTLPDYVSLKGSGRGSRLQADGGITALTIGRGCQVSGMSIRGDATAGSVGVAFAEDAGHWSITDCWISGHETGIVLTETYVGSVTRCYVLSNVTGIRVTGANVNAINVTGGEIQGNSGDGVYCDTGASTGVKFRGTTIEGNAGYGFHNAGAPYGWVIRDCYFESNASGHIYSSTNARALRIDGNTFSGSGAPINLANAFDTAIESNIFNHTVGPKSITCASSVQRTTIARNWYRLGNEFVPATDYLGTSLLILDRELTFPASTTSAASLNVPHGAAPTSPVNGDVWTTTAGAFVRTNGATKQLADTASAAAAPTAWTTIINGFTNAKFTAGTDPPQFRLVNGFCEFSGLILVGGGAGVAALDVVTLLPAGHRPPTATRFYAYYVDTALIVRINVAIDGYVKIAAAGATVTSIDLIGGRFRVA